MSEDPIKYGERKDWYTNGLQIPEERIREAMSKTPSNKKAAQYLEVSYPTYKKYAKAYVDMETGKTLFDLHQNQAGRGIVGRTWVGGKMRLNWDNILRPNQRATPERIEKLKHNLKQHQKLEEKCYRCNFNERRVEDNKIPLILNFKNGDKTDWTVQNLEFVCYNCAYLHCLDFYEDSVVDKVEKLSILAPQGRKDRQKFLELDDFYMDHVNKLGISIEDLPSQEKNITNSDIKDDFSDFIDYV